MTNGNNDPHVPLQRSEQSKQQLEKMNAKVELQVYRVFMYQNRGNETYVGIDYAQEAKLSQEQAEAAMKLCPTGSIIVRGKSQSKPFGERLYDLKSTQKGFSRKLNASHSTSGPMERKRIATTSLAGCFGCHMSMLDVDTDLLDLVEVLDFHKSPLTDIKDFSSRCHIGLIEGGCCNADNVEVLKHFRDMCDILVCVGECAVWGGLPAMRNTIPLSECLEEAYLNCITNDPQSAQVPYHEDLPKLVSPVYRSWEIVKISRIGQQKVKVTVQVHISSTAHLQAEPRVRGSTP